MKPRSSDFPGSETYFTYFSDGRWDELSRIRFIYPTAEAQMSADGTALNIGRPGVDGLEFAYRAGLAGIWVWYPLDSEWRKVAADITTLEHEWLSGKLTV